MISPSSSERVNEVEIINGSEARVRHTHARTQSSEALSSFFFSLLLLFYVSFTPPTYVHSSCVDHVLCGHVRWVPKPEAMRLRRGDLLETPENPLTPDMPVLLSKCNISSSIPPEAEASRDDAYTPALVVVATNATFSVHFKGHCVVCVPGTIVVVVRPSRLGIIASLLEGKRTLLWEFSTHVTHSQCVPGVFVFVVLALLAVSRELALEVLLHAGICAVESYSCCFSLLISRSLQRTTCEGWQN